MFETDSVGTASLDRRPVLRLQYQDGERLVFVDPQDRDRFVLRVDQAIAGCKLAIAREQAKSRIDFLLKLLGRWKNDQNASRQKIESMFLTLRDGHLTALIVQSSLEFCSEFEEAVSALDWKLAWDEEVKALQVQVFSVPRVDDETLSGFLHPVFNIRF